MILDILPFDSAAVVDGLQREKRAGRRVIEVPRVATPWSPRRRIDGEVRALLNPLVVVVFEVVNLEAVDPETIVLRVFHVGPTHLGQNDLVQARDVLLVVQLRCRGGTTLAQLDRHFS